jgi:hypothetical protein
MANEPKDNAPPPPADSATPSSEPATTPSRDAPPPPASPPLQGRPVPGIRPSHLRLDSRVPPEEERGGELLLDDVRKDKK